MSREDSPPWFNGFFNFPCGQSSSLKPHTYTRTHTSPTFFFLQAVHFTSWHIHTNILSPTLFLSYNHSLPLLSHYLSPFLLPFHSLFKNMRPPPTLSASVHTHTHTHSLITSPHRSTLWGTAHNWLGSSVVLGRVRLQVQIPSGALLYTIRSPANLKGPESQYTASCANNPQSC